jgi:hypothetical protein
MNLILNLSSSELDGEDLQALTRELCEEIKAETDIQANLASQNSANAKCGGLIELGMIALTFLGTDAGKGLIEFVKLIKDLIRRESSIEIIVQKPDGTVIKVTAKNVKEAERIFTELLRG